MDGERMAAGMLDDRVVLITGGTGSLGRQLTRQVLERARPRRLIIFSRDELKQDEMRRGLAGAAAGVRFVLGDVRDPQALSRALRGVDVLVHAAALKQVPTCERNPLEAVKTNVLGAANLIEAAIDRGVERVLAVSSDKAAQPVNLYGATKLCADKLFLAADETAASEGQGTRFAVVRYGNVVGSRGSVVPLFQGLRASGVLPITDPRMTRFWLTLDQAGQFVLDSLEQMRGGEVFVPKIPSVRIVDLARAMAPECQTRIVGIRPGEKLHEVLLIEDESRQTLEYARHYAVFPQHDMWRLQEAMLRTQGCPCQDGFRYASDTNPAWLGVDDLRQLLGIAQEGALVA
jgi:UDP-N-acetylglucosamine 4,6-dehydratase